MREQVIAMLTALGVTGAAEDPLLDIVISNVQYRVQNKTNRKDMLTISTQELEQQAPKILEKKLYLFLKGCFDA